MLSPLNGSFDAWPVPLFDKRIHQLGAVQMAPWFENPFWSVPGPESLFTARSAELTIPRIRVVRISVLCYH